MSQKRLNGLAILSIEQNLSENIEYKSLISNFVAETICRVIFQLLLFFKDRRPHFFCTAPGLIILRADPSPITTQKIKISECDFFGENISDPYFFIFYLF